MILKEKLNGLWRKDDINQLHHKHIYNKSRCQRGRCEVRYKDNKDGTITDTKTNLMWQKETISKSFTWDEAIEYCKDLNLAEHRDWRSPTIEELISIVDYGRYDPSISPTFNVVLSRYWSSTTYASYPYFAWLVSFYYGCVHGCNKSDHNYVRAVSTVREVG